MGRCEVSGETPQPAAPEAVLDETLFDLTPDTVDMADAPVHMSADEARAWVWGYEEAMRRFAETITPASVLAALREAGYTVARLEQVGWAYCATYEGPHAFDNVPVWRVVGPVEPSPPGER